MAKVFSVGAAMTVALVGMLVSCSSCMSRGRVLPKGQGDCDEALHDDGSGSEGRRDTGGK